MKLITALFIEKLKSPGNSGGQGWRLRGDPLYTVYQLQISCQSAGLLLGKGWKESSHTQWRFTTKSTVLDYDKADESDQ